MKLVGKVFGVLRDKNTGKVTKTFKGTNHFQDQYLSSLADNTSTGLDLGTKLFVSEFNPGRQRYDYSYNLANCWGSNSAIARDIIIDDQNNAHLIQILQRFDAPPHDITINLAGICSAISPPATLTTANDVQTAVWFDTPCIQTSSETLDLYYRVYFLFDANWKNASATSDAMNRLEMEYIARFFHDNGSYFMQPYYNISAPAITAANKFNSRILDYANFSNDNSKLDVYNIAIVNLHDPTYFRRGVTLSPGIDEGVGQVIGMMGTDKGLFLSKVNPPNTSPLQSVFGHRDNAIGPFYDAGSAQLSLGKLNINGDAWTDPDFPKLFKINIQTDGLTGTSTYNFTLRNHFGFNGNTYNNLSSDLPFTSAPNKHYAGGMAMCRDDYANNPSITIDEAGSVATPIRYNKDEVLFLYDNEIKFMNINTAEGETFDNTTLVGLDNVPRFLATSIGQVFIDSNLNAYISCANTGLYKFNAARDTLTIINSSTTGLSGVTGCSGICEGFNGRLWAFFNHSTQPSLYYSDDDGVSWSNSGMTDPAYFDLYPTQIISIKADKNTVDGHIMLYYFDEGNTLTTGQTSVKWWNQSTSTLSLGPADTFRAIDSLSTCRPMFTPGQRHQLQNIIDCSPNNSYWGCLLYKPNTFTANVPGYFEFGTTNINVTTDATHNVGSYMTNISWLADSAGNDAMFYVTFPGQLNNSPTGNGWIVLLSYDLTIEGAEAIGESNTNNSIKDTIMYLHDGVWLGANIHRTTSYSSINYNQFVLSTFNPVDPSITGVDNIIKEVEPTYGWNGSAWVKGDPGMKPTHATAEELIQGVTIAFDDVAGTAPFLASDYYTFGLFDGIWQDGSTTFDYTMEVYVKPTSKDTDLEATTLPAVTKVSNEITSFSTAQDTDYQDLLGMDAGNVVGAIYGTGTALEGDYNSGGRSAYKAIEGSQQSYLPNTVIVPDSEKGITNAQGWFSFQAYVSSADSIEFYIGLSDSTVLGTPLDANTIQYGFHLDSVTPGNGPGTMTVSVVESGAVRANITDVPYSTTVGVTSQFRIILLVDGSMAYEVYLVSTGLWEEIYRTPPGTVVIQDYYLDFMCVPRSNYGLRDVTSYTLDVANPDYFLYLGDGVSTGLFANDFYGVDPKYTTITIDGVEAVNIGENDTSTVLAANSYSIFPLRGVIRYSASDVGKSISAVYTTITHQ